MVVTGEETGIEMNAVQSQLVLCAYGGPEGDQEGQASKVSLL